MSVSLVLTLLGQDRHGLVEAVSQRIAARGGSWLESRMVRLAGKFAGVLLVEVGEEQAADLTASLKALTSEGLTIVVEPTSVAGAVAATQLLDLEVFGPDRQGIVREIASVLAARAVSVDELETELRSAPMSGETMFHANAKLRAPADVSAHELRAALEAGARDVTVDVTAAQPAR